MTTPVPKSAVNANHGEIARALLLFSAREKGKQPSLRGRSDQ
jgi:hypothetical protein